VAAAEMLPIDQPDFLSFTSTRKGGAQQVAVDWQFGAYSKAPWRKQSPAARLGEETMLREIRGIF